MDKFVTNSDPKFKSKDNSTVTFNTEDAENNSMPVWEPIDIGQIEAFPSRIPDTPRVPSIHNQSPKKSFTNQISDVLTSNILLRSVAVTSVIGVAFFYFGGLQPLIFSKYTDSVLEKVNNLEKNFIKQSEAYTVVQSDIIDKFTQYNPIENCADSQFTEIKNSSFGNMDLLAKQILPDQTLQNIPKYNDIFYDNSIEQKYANLYQKYEDSLANYYTVYKELTSVPVFLSYRNNWINTCKEIQSSQGNLSAIQTSCKNLIAKINTYDFSNQISIWSEIQKINQKNEAQCNEVINYKDTGLKVKNIFPTFGRWYLQWLANFENITNLKINFEKNTSLLKNTNKEFSSSVSKTKKDIEMVINSKDNLENKLYIIDYKI